MKKPIIEFIDLNNQSIINIPFFEQGFILSKKYKNQIIRLDPTISHEDNFKEIIKNYYWQEWFYFIDQQQKLILPQTNNFIDSPEMICAIFLSSLDEIVCINTSDFNDLKLLNEKKLSLYQDRYYYNFSYQFYIPQNINYLDKMQILTLKHYQNDINLMNLSAPSSEIILVPNLNKMKKQKYIYLDLITSNCLFKKIINK